MHTTAEGNRPGHRSLAIPRCCLFLKSKDASTEEKYAQTLNQRLPQRQFQGRSGGIQRRANRVDVLQRQHLQRLHCRIVRSLQGQGQRLRSQRRLVLRLWSLQLPELEPQLHSARAPGSWPRTRRHPRRARHARTGHRRPDCP